MDTVLFIGNFSSAILVCGHCGHCPLWFW